MRSTPCHRAQPVFYWLAVLVFFLIFAGHAATLFPTNTSWKYFKGLSEGSLPDVTAWRAVEFDDTLWPMGPAPFSYGESLGGTSVNDMPNNYTALFLRRRFVVTNIYEFGALTLSAKCDDGYIAWLNGVEVARYNVAPWFVPYYGLALS